MAGVRLPDSEATQAAGRRLGQALRAGDVVILTGPLGAGKTTFTQGIGEGLGVRGPITSPTFVIARVHPSLVNGPELLHVDAYRLDTAGQLWDLDLDTDSAVTVVEWGKGKAEGLADDWLELTIERSGGAGSEGGGAASDGVAQIADESRLITWHSQGSRWAELDIGAVLSGSAQ